MLREAAPSRSKLLRTPRSCRREPLSKPAPRAWRLALAAGNSYLRRGGVRSVSSSTGGIQPRGAAGARQRSICRRTARTQKRRKDL